MIAPKNKLFSMDYNDISGFSWHRKGPSKATALFSDGNALNTEEMKNVKAGFFLPHLCRCYVFCTLLSLPFYLFPPKNNF